MKFEMDVRDFRERSQPSMLSPPCVRALVGEAAVLIYTQRQNRSIANLTHARADLHRKLTK